MTQTPATFLIRVESTYRVVAETEAEAFDAVIGQNATLVEHDSYVVDVSA